MDKKTEEHTNLHLITDAEDITSLKYELDEFDFSNPPFDSLEVGEQMIKFMYELNGLGLAANQVGIDSRIFVMRGTMTSGDFICINPVIVGTSAEEILLDESCLSFPGLSFKIKRPRHCRIRFKIPDGTTQTCQFTGMTARVVQHEMDHLDGVLFYNRASKYHRDLGFRNRGKYVSNTKSLLSAVSPFDIQIDSA